MTKFVLILILLLVVLPPLVFNYQYPSYGDDSFYHMERIDEIQQQGIGITDSRYIGQNFTWLVLLPFGDSDYSFVWFNWLALGACMFAMYLFGRKLADRQTGLAMLVCGALVAPAFISLFHNGTIYNLINFYIFGLSASFCLLRWLETDRWYYFITSLLLFTIVGIYQSSSAAIIAAAVTIFLTANLIAAYRRHDFKKLKKVGAYTICYLMVGIGIAYLLNPELHRMIDQILSADLSGRLQFNTPEMSPDQRVYIGQWFIKGWSPWLGIMVIVSLLILRKAKANVNWKLVGLLGSFCAVLAIGTFTSLFYDAVRFSFDLSIMTSLLAAYIIVLGIRARKEIKYTVAVWGVLALCMIPALFWFWTFNNAMTPADINAANYLNSIGAESYTTSSQIQHRIYDRFVDAEYSYPDAEYMIYRNEHQTIQCLPEEDNLWWHYNDHYPNESKPWYYAEMEEVGIWQFREVEVTIYRSNQ